MQAKHFEPQFDPPPERKEEFEELYKEFCDREKGLDKLGEGSFAKVVKFVDERTGETYAVKKMLKHTLKTQSAGGHDMFK